MSNETHVDGQVSKDRTFIQDARRTQLVACAIEELAESGYAQASLVRIARRAKVSRGVITYHFRDRDDLIGAVVTEVYAIGAAMLRPRIEAAPTAADAVRTFIVGSAEFYRAYPAHMSALREIIANARSEDGTLRHVGQAAAEEQELKDVGELLTLGQRGGEFCDFEPRIMARTIRHALNGLLQDMQTASDFDPVADANEMADIFARAMARP